MRRAALPFLFVILLACPVRATSTYCAPQALGEIRIVEETAGFKINIKYPVLCRTDATRILRDHVTHALSEFKREFPEHDLTDYRHKHEMMTEYTTWAAENGRLVSIKLLTMVYTGGAHPNNWPETWVFDLTTGTQISMEALFIDMDKALVDIAPMVRDELKKNLGQMALDDMLRPGTTPEQTNYKDFVLTTEGITFFFAPYQVAPYAAGEQNATIGYDRLAPYLAPAFKHMVQ